MTKTLDAVEGLLENMQEFICSNILEPSLQALVVPFWRNTRSRHQSLADSLHNALAVRGESELGEVERGLAALKQELEKSEAFRKYLWHKELLSIPPMNRVWSVLQKAPDGHAEEELESDSAMPSDQEEPIYCLEAELAKAQRENEELIKSREEKKYDITYLTKSQFEAIYFAVKGIQVNADTGFELELNMSD